MLYSFRLVLEGKTSTRIPQALRLGFLEKFLANNFALSAAENNTSRQLNRGSIVYLFAFAENTISNSPKLSTINFLGSGRLLFFISICKFDSFKNFFATITSLPELYFRFRRFILLVQTEKVISMSYGRTFWN